MNLNIGCIETHRNAVKLKGKFEMNLNIGCIETWTFQNNLLCPSYDEPQHWMY